MVNNLVALDVSTSLHCITAGSLEATVLSSKIILTVRSAKHRAVKTVVLSSCMSAMFLLGIRSSLHSFTITAFTLVSFTLVAFLHNE